MQPRVTANIDGIQTDLWFDNTADGWDKAWTEYNSLIALSANVGFAQLEYCGHKVNESCVLVQRASWGSED